MRTAVAIRMPFVAGAVGAVLVLSAGLLGSVSGSDGEPDYPRAAQAGESTYPFRAVAPGIAKDSGTYTPPEPTSTPATMPSPTQTPEGPTAIATPTGTPTATATAIPTSTPVPTSSPTPGAGGPSYGYVALGDSLATGVLAFRGYVPRYADHVRADTGAGVTVDNRGQNGWTSDQLLQALKTSSQMRQAVSRADVVTWDIGGNDLRAARSAYKAGTCGGADNEDCLRATEASVKGNWDAIIAELLALRSVDDAVIRTMDIYNPYVNEDKSDGSFDVFKGYLDRVNEHIKVASEAAGVPVAGVYAAFNGPDGQTHPGQYLTFDGLHPNDSGHALIAQLFRGLGYEPLHP